MRYHGGPDLTKDAKVPPPRHNRSPYRSQSRAPGLDGGTPERVRGDAMTKHARYLDLAQDAKAAGDEITAQGHLQYAEHWYRTAMADRRPPEPVEELVGDDGMLWKPVKVRGRDRVPAAPTVAAPTVAVPTTWTVSHGVAVSAPAHSATPPTAGGLAPPAPVARR